MAESSTGQHGAQLPQDSQRKSFESSPSQAELRPSALESHLAREILNWQERSPKPLRVLGEPLVF